MLKKKNGRPSKRPKLQDFEKHWDKMTRAELAEHYGVSEVTISRWAREFRNEEEER